MKNVEYSDSLKKTPGLLELAEESTKRLDDLIGTSEFAVHA